MTGTSSAATAPPLRCAVHPSRPAVDRCPVCERPRCGADAAAPGPGCPACSAPGPERSAGAPPPSDLERLVRAALAGLAVALLGGLIASEYVGAAVFDYLGPIAVGVVVGAAATKAAGGGGRGPTGLLVRVLAAVLSVFSVALGFVLEESQHPLSARPAVLLPYAAAVAGAVLWTIPPRRRQGLSTEV